MHALRGAKVHQWEDENDIGGEGRKTIHERGSNLRPAVGSIFIYMYSYEPFRIRDKIVLSGHAWFGQQCSLTP